MALGPNATKQEIIDRRVFVIKLREEGKTFHEIADIIDVCTDRASSIYRMAVRRDGKWGGELWQKRGENAKRTREIKEYKIAKTRLLITFFTKNPQVLKIEQKGGSGNAPTGVAQFINDWPGLWIRGDHCGAWIDRLNGLQRTYGMNHLILRQLIELFETTQLPNKTD